MFYFENSEHFFWIIRINNSIFFMHFFSPRNQFYQNVYFERQDSKPRTLFLRSFSTNLALILIALQEVRQLKEFWQLKPPISMYFTKKLPSSFPTSFQNCLRWWQEVLFFVAKVIRIFGLVFDIF